MTTPRLGSDTPSKLYLGSDVPSKLYLGSDLIYSTAVAPPLTPMLTAAQLYAFLHGDLVTLYTCHFRTGVLSGQTIFTRRSQDTPVGTFIAEADSPSSDNSPHLGRVRINGGQIRLNKNPGDSINYNDTYTGDTFGVFKPDAMEYIQLRMVDASVSTGGGFITLAPSGVNSDSGWGAWRLSDSNGDITSGQGDPGDILISRFIASLTTANQDLIYAVRANQAAIWDPYNDFS